MTKDQIESVLDRVRDWPPERQADAARLLQTLEKAGTGTHILSADEAAALDDGLAQADAGDFVSDADMTAFWNRNRHPK